MRWWLAMLLLSLPFVLAECGDGICDPGEEPYMPALDQGCIDCGILEWCGDGLCQKGELPFDPRKGTGCLDCGVVEWCGDGICQEINNESCQTCPEDCGECVPLSAWSLLSVLTVALAGWFWWRGRND